MKIGILKLSITLCLLISCTLTNFCGVRISIKESLFKKVIEKELKAHDYLGKTISQSFDNFENTQTKLGISFQTSLYDPHILVDSLNPAVTFENGNVNVVIEAKNIFVSSGCKFGLEHGNPICDFTAMMEFEKFKLEAEFKFLKDAKTHKLTGRVEKAKVNFDLNLNVEKLNRFVTWTLGKTQDFIVEKIKAYFNKHAAEMVTPYLSGYLETMNPYAGVISDLNMDYSLYEDPVVQNGRINFYITGLLFKGEDRKTIDQLLTNFEKECQTLSSNNILEKDLFVMMSDDTLNHNLSMLVQNNQLETTYSSLKENDSDWKEFFSVGYMYDIKVISMDRFSSSDGKFALKNVKVESHIYGAAVVDHFDKTFISTVSVEDLELSSEKSLMTKKINTVNVKFEFKKEEKKTKPQGLFQNLNAVKDKIKNKVVTKIEDVYSSLFQKAVQKLKKKLDGQTRLMLQPVAGYQIASLDLHFKKGYFNLGFDIFAAQKKLKKLKK